MLAVPDYPAVTLKPMEQVMQLSLFLTILLSLSCGTITTDASTGRFPIVGSVLILVMITSIMHLLGNRAIHAVQNDLFAKQAIANRLESQLACLRWISLMAVFACLVKFGLASLIANSRFTEHSLALQSLLLLLPGTILNLYCIYTAERFNWNTRSSSLNRRDQIKLVLTKFRFVLALGIFPILILLGLIDLVGLLPLDSGYAATLTFGLVILFITLVSPSIASYFIDTEPLDNEQKQWVNHLTNAAGLGKIQIAVWNTNLSSMNALVVGFVSPFRKLLISDALVAALPRKQLAMVILHEAAHLKRKHLPIRMASIIPIWLVAAGIAPWFQNNAWFAPLASLICVILTIMTLRWVAHHTEHDADLEACRLAAKIGTLIDDIPTNQAEAGRELSRALLTITSERASAKKTSWMHPGVLARIQAMRADHQPTFLTTNSSSITIG